MGNFTALHPLQMILGAPDCFKEALVAVILISIFLPLGIWWRLNWSRFSAPVRALTAIALVHIVLIQGILSLISPRHWRDTALLRTEQFFIARESDDSWHPMFAAYDYAVQQDHRPLYTEIFFERKIKFQYPPTALLFVAALKPLLPQQTFRQHMEGPARVVSWLFIWLSVLCSMALLLLTLRSRTQPQPKKQDLIAAAALVVLLGLTFYPVIHSYNLGQIQTWINGLLALALLCLATRRELGAGILTGIVCLMKPTYGVLVLWGLARRRWRFALSAIGVGVAGLCLSIAIFGWADHVDYPAALAFMARHGEAYFPNQSMNGLLNRLFHNGTNLEWLPNDFAPFHPVVYAGTLASSLALIGGLLWIACRGRNEPSPFEPALAILTSTMASPIAWEHHYGVLLPIYALLASTILTKASPFRGEKWWLAASFLMTASFFAPVNQTADLPFGLNVLQSHLYCGALISLFLLYKNLSQEILKQQR